MLRSSCPLLLCGCQEVRIESGDVLHDKVTVIEVSYVPAHTDITFSCGLGFDGEFSCGPGRSSVPDKYRVTMRSERCTFTFADAESYRHFQESVGQTAEVLFRESYRAVYEKEQGAERLVSREFMACQFVGLAPR